MTYDLAALHPDLVHHPLARDGKCPFRPAEKLREVQQQDQLTPVTMPAGTTAWLVARHEDARALLGDARVSSDPTKPGFPSTIALPEASGDEAAVRFFIQMDDPEHAEVRRMATPPFTVKAVRAAEPRIDSVINSLVDDMLAGSNPTDFVSAFALALPTFMICDILGAPYDESGVFHDTTQIMVDTTSTPEERAAAQLDLQVYLADLYERKSKDPQDDLFSQLFVQYVSTGQLSHAEAIGMGIMLLIAGHETTANTTALGLLALLQHPEQLALVRENLDDARFMANVVEELLRYTSVVREPLRRAVLEDIEYNGQRLKAGDGIMVPLDIANRDPQMFAEPDVLDVTRKARTHVAFGFGVHQCVGQQLARLELVRAFTILLQRIPRLELAIDPDDAAFKHEALVFGLHELPVRW